eukprot:4003712-Ditylum_brightwellii.AAC.1
MQYPRAVTSLSKETCLQITKPFVYTILPKMGFNQHTAREIIYGSTQFGGSQFAHLYNEQGYLALKHLLGHLHKKPITGNQIMIALSYTQLVAGSSEPYLQEVLTNRSYVPTSWLSNIRTFLCTCKGSLLIPDLWLPHPQRDFDKILMNVFEASKPSDTTLEKLNMVRLYLGTLTLADIVSDDGRNILPWALTGRSRAKPMIPWPNQGLPPDSHWVLWHRFLKDCFAPYTSQAH